MKPFSAAFVILFVLSMAGIVNANEVVVAVNGQSGPWVWSDTLNSAHSYGVPVGGSPNFNLPPTIVAAGLAMTSGDTLTIRWLSGDVCGGANGTAWTNGANGNSGWGIYNNPTEALSTPAYYIPSGQFPVLFMQLMGVFADSAGVIVGDPFKLGNVPVTVSIPNGSSQLQLGFVDGWYNDNFATLQVGVTEAVSAVPEPATMLLLGFGLAGLAGMRRFRK